jgi:hypothetical protein
MFIYKISVTFLSFKACDTPVYVMLLELACFTCLFCMLQFVQTRRCDYSVPFLVLNKGPFPCIHVICTDCIQSKIHVCYILIHDAMPVQSN